METPTTTTTASSPEFEFWQVRNPSSQQPTLHSADQLFSDGVLLPLRLLTTDDPPDINHITTTSPEVNNNINPPSLTQDPDKKTTFTASKRWKDIFKKNPEAKDSEKKKKKNSGGSGGGSGTGGGGGVTGTAELNINLWPFSRSRSAGTTGSRQRTVAGNRKVSSAPCSRSNSTGDKYRKWPTSPARPGVHLGRSSPVWQAKRVGQTRSLGAKSKVLNNVNVNNVNVNVNVPTCIGYRQRMSCNAGVKGGVTTVTGGGDGGGATTGLFNLRSLFTKKVF